jgi:hypothetical protein
VRVDVEGIKQKEEFFDSLEDLVENIGEAFVVIGTAVVVIAVVALVIYADPDGAFDSLIGSKEVDED